MVHKVGDIFLDIRANGGKVNKDVRDTVSNSVKELNKLDKEFERSLAKMNSRIRATGDGFDKLFRGEMTKSFSENISRAFTKGVVISMRDGENAAYQFSHGLGVISESLVKVKSKGELAAEGFQRLQRVGYNVQVAIGTLAATIGDLSLTLVAAVGVVGAAAPALISVGAAAVGIGAGFIAAKIAMTGVSTAAGALWKSQTALNDTFRAAKQEFIGLKFAAEDAALSEEDASLRLEKAREALARVQDLPPDNRLRRETELQYKRADLALRQAKQKTQESFRAVKKGITATSAYQPLAGLSKSQMAFTLFLVKLRPLIKSLEDAVSRSFLPKFQKSIATVVTYGLPSIKKGLVILGSAMGDAAIKFANVFKDQSNIRLLDAFFRNSKSTVKTLGSVMAHAFGGLLAVLEAVDPLVKRFAGWVDTSISNWEKKVKFQNLTGQLGGVFKLAGDVSAKLGGIFKNVYDGVKNIVKAAFPSGVNSGAGGVLLDWLNKVTTGWRDFSKDAGFSNMFKQATINGTTALSTIGQLLKVFVDLAGKKETEQFWLTLRDSVPFVKKILDDGARLAPLFAQTLVTLAEMLSLLSDTGVLDSFFTTLNTILEIVSSILAFLKPILDSFGVLHGVILAILASFLLFRKAFMIILGYLIKMGNATGTLMTKTKAYKTSISDALIQIVRLNEIARKSGQKELSTMKELSIIIDKVRQRSQQIKATGILAMAKAAGMTKKELKLLDDQMKQNIATNKRLTAGTGLGGGMGLTTSKKAGLGVGIGMATMAATDMISAGGVTASGALGAAGGVASMFGPIGMGVGATLGIASAITKGFEEAATKRKEAQKDINIQVATINVAKQAADKGKFAAIAKGGYLKDPAEISKAVNNLNNTAQSLFTTKIGVGSNVKNATDVGKIQQVYLNNEQLVNTFGRNSNLSKQLTTTTAKFANMSGISGEDAARGIGAAISATTADSAKAALGDLGFSGKTLKSLDLSGLKAGTSKWTSAINKFILKTPGIGAKGAGSLQGAAKETAKELALKAFATGKGVGASSVFDSKTGKLKTGTEVAQKKTIKALDTLLGDLGSEIKRSTGGVVPGGKGALAGGGLGMYTYRNKTYTAEELNNILGKKLGLKPGQFSIEKYTALKNAAAAAVVPGATKPGSILPSTGPQGPTASTKAQDKATDATKTAADKLQKNTNAVSTLINTLDSYIQLTGPSAAGNAISSLAIQWLLTAEGKRALPTGTAQTQFIAFLVKMGFSAAPASGATN